MQVHTSVIVKWFRIQVFVSRRLLWLGKKPWPSFNSTYSNSKPLWMLSLQYSVQIISHFRQWPGISFSQGSGLSLSVFAPCDTVSPSCWLLMWFQVSLLSSSLSCVYKPRSIHLVFVCSWMSSLCSMPPIWIIKDSRFVNIPRLLVQCSLRSVTPFFKGNDHFNI